VIEVYIYPHNHFQIILQLNTSIVHPILLTENRTDKSCACSLRILRRSTSSSFRSRSAGRPNLEMNFVETFGTENQFKLRK